ncbi:MAG: GMC family oxidoreductase [Elusimicrobia bacterium]|nr:GMC family oxidoreductase [Elusimicrobiota bacterium]
MKVSDWSALSDGSEFDFAIVGSGFGGSVAALRLAEKGYSVAVLEAGRHFEDADFPKTNWNAPRYLWAPRLGCWGIQRIDLLEHALVLSGAGVGGGSLVYANTLLEPSGAFYTEAAGLEPRFEEKLKTHLATARRMLGATVTPRLFAADEELKRAATELGRGESFSRATVGVYFGEAGRTVADPFFDGRGPQRAGCRFCGGCMVGCRHNAKNTLAKNYLPLAVALGARVFARSCAVRLADRPGGGLLVDVRRSGWGWTTKTLRARGLVVAAGVLGTMRLLQNPDNAIGRLPPRLGRDVRTNGEALLGAFARTGARDWSEGIAIASGVWVDEETHVEPVRYPAGSDAMGLLGVARGAGLADRLRSAWPFGWARRATVLLAMQTRDSRLRLVLRAGGRLSSEPEPGYAPPSARLPAAERLQQVFCRNSDAIAMTNVAEAWLGRSATAHILGGACRAAGPEAGCTGPDGRLFGRRDLWIVDGSSVPANPGVNPSLTIAALAESAMAHVPAKGAPGAPA